MTEIIREGFRPMSQEELPVAKIECEYCGCVFKTDEYLVYKSGEGFQIEVKCRNEYCGKTITFWVSGRTLMRESKKKKRKENLKIKKEK